MRLNCLIEYNSTVNDVFEQVLRGTNSYHGWSISN